MSDDIKKDEKTEERKALEAKVAHDLQILIQTLGDFDDEDLQALNDLLYHNNLT